ncbi:MAG: lysozyme inhibitor LprI family protein [Gallionella sp.]
MINKNNMKCALYLFGWLVMSLPAQAASFDCGKAVSKIEKLICGNDELSKLDETLNKTYQQALTRSGDDKPQVIAEQRQWLKTNNAICKDVVCVKERCLKRIHELTEYSYVPAHFGACETDPNHTMQQIIDDDVMGYLRNHYGFAWADSKLVDFYRIPKGISFKPITGTYINVKQSAAYLLPEISDAFHTIGLAYGMGRYYEFKAICEVITRQGDAMLVFRKEAGTDRGVLQYVPKKDFELSQTPEE